MSRRLIMVDSTQHLGSGKLDLCRHPHVGPSAADWSTQSHTWTEPSEAADSSVRERSGCQTWEVTKTWSSDCDETA